MREALRGLEALGVVEILPFRGARVRRPSTQELLEAYVVRSALEAPRRAAGGAGAWTDADLAELAATATRCSAPRSRAIAMRSRSPTPAFTAADRRRAECDPRARVAVAGAVLAHLHHAGGPGRRRDVDGEPPRADPRALQRRDPDRRGAALRRAFRRGPRAPRAGAGRRRCPRAREAGRGRTRPPRRGCARGRAARQPTAQEVAAPARATRAADSPYMSSSASLGPDWT